MAKKKTARKPAKPSSSAAKKPVKQVARSAAAKAPAKPARGPAKKVVKAAGPTRGPRPVNTGKGATALELGAGLVKYFNQGEGDAWVGGVWSKDIVSCEGLGVNMEFAGLQAVEEKNAQWHADHEVLGGSAEGPYVGSTGFSVKFSMHVKQKSSGQEIRMEEIGVYTVRDGKIVREEFMYSAIAPAGSNG